MAHGVDHGTKRSTERLAMRKIKRRGLANYAMAVEATAGRRFPEPPHPYRNEYERDRDRIIHSRAFRRLEDKTQVFTRRSSDHFRNRLTHTLEVAQISRTVAQALCLNADLVEALALVHDVGHPPFGHVGEGALRSLMQDYGDTFDHNLHALRIVESFEHKYVEFTGLNLTFEVREGIIKHSRGYDPKFYPALVDYRLEDQPPLEAQLIDLADEIAYNCSDLDDGYESKLLTVPLIRRAVPLFRRIYDSVERKYPWAIEKLKFNEALKRLMDTLVSDLIEATRDQLQKGRVRSVEQVRARRGRLVGLSRRVAVENRRIKEFLYAKLYFHPKVRAERKLIVREMKGLFQFFVDHPRRLPASYFAQMEHEPIHRVVCDYIAGMTDHYLQERYRKYLGP
jgi:dGTPase